MPRKPTLFICAIGAVVMLSACSQVGGYFSEKKASFDQVFSSKKTSLDLSFSDGSSGKCMLFNKNTDIEVRVPSKPKVSKSDDALVYDCITEASGSARGEIALYDDNYPSSFVIPITR